MIIFNRPVLTGDVDGDGKTDLIFQYKSTTTDKLMIRVLFSRGNGDFYNPVGFDSDDGDIAGIPISYKHMTSFILFVITSISPVLGNCLNP